MKEKEYLNTLIDKIIDITLGTKKPNQYVIDTLNEIIERHYDTIRVYDLYKYHFNEIIKGKEVDSIVFSKKHDIPIIKKIFFTDGFCLNLYGSAEVEDTDVYGELTFREGKLVSNK